MLLPLIWGRARPLLALFTLLLPSLGQAAAGGEADVQLRTDLNTMFVRVDQSAPLPPGGCVGGYSWHTTYGGCRRVEVQSETAQCDAGWLGTRTRYRNAYVLQANGNDVVYEGWGAWYDSCYQPRLAGVVDAIVAKARGSETGDSYGINQLFGNIAREMSVNYGTTYGVTIHRPTASLNCVYASGTSDNRGTPIWYGRLLAPGDSMMNNPSGYCQIANGGQSAEVFGSCDGDLGGDGGFCRSATRTVQIIGTSACSVTTQTAERGKVIAVNSYSLC